MSESAPILLLRVVDVLIVIVTIGVLWYIVSRRLTYSKLVPSNGRWLILIGIVMLLAEQLVSFGVQLSTTGISTLAEPNFHPTAAPLMVYWVLSRGGFLLLVSGSLVAVLQRKRAEAAIGVSQSEMIRAAQVSVIESENRFRSLLETTSGSAYCFAFDPPVPISAPVEEHVRRSHDAALIECNVSFVEAISKKHAGDAMGVRYGELDSALDTKSHEAMIREFVNSGFNLQDYDLVYSSPEGEDRALNISWTGIIQDGLLLRFWGAETDILEIRETQSALDRRRGFQDLIAGISSYMIMTPIERSNEIIEHCLEEICTFIGADRSSLVWINWHDQAGQVSFRWSAADYPVPDSVSIHDFPYLSASVRAGRVIRLNDIEDLPAKAEEDKRRLRNWEMKSLVALPLMLAGEVSGLVTFATSDKPKEWSDQDVLDLRVTSELFANFVSRLRSSRELDNALEELSSAKERLEAENVYLREEIERTHGFDEIVGESEAILRSLRMVEMVAETDTPVLILGETGTGKELIARAIHQRSLRRDRPLVKVNCAALPGNLIESELFGYEKGAFTGADARKRGRFDLADGSTLFLDEFGEMPLDLQTKLLRVLQEGEFERLGGTETIKVDVRLIVATNRNLAESVKNGTFRSDLYYRVNTFPISLPPLRDRSGDVEMLAQHFVKVHSKGLGKEVQGISFAMMRQLAEFHWPGNVRELEGVIQRAVIAHNGGLLELPEPLVVEDMETSGNHRIISTTISDLSMVERDHIISVLEDTGWKISGPNGAATRLGLPPSTLRSKMKKLSILKPH